MASTENGATTPTGNGSNTLIDSFEAAFQNCLSILIKEDNFNTQDREDIRAHAEASVLQFMDCARQLEQSFLQKRLLLSVHRPELVVKEDTQELRQELMRKEELIRRNQDKMAQWKTMLSDVQPQQRPGAGEMAAPSEGQPGGGALAYRGPAPAGYLARSQASLPGHLAYLEKQTSNIGSQEPPR